MGIVKRKNVSVENISLKLEPLHAPVVVVVVQSAVLGHCLGEGFVFGSQFDVLQRKSPGVPEPAPTPHFVAHPLGSVCVHVPKEMVASNNRA